MPGAAYLRCGLGSAHAVTVFRQGATPILFAGALLLTLLTQWQLGAARGGFANDPAAHYVTALLIHDWLTTWPLQSPVPFLVKFHAHYPLVTIGGWPPAFHVLYGAAMTVLPSGYSGTLLFSALVTAALATVTGLAVRRFGWAWAVAAAMCIVLSPVVRAETSQLMADVFTAILCFAACLAFARFLRTGAWTDSAWFGLLAVVALYAKGNAGALALLPLLALVLARQVNWLQRGAFWVAAPLVVLLVGPWYYFTAWRAQEGARFTAGLDYTATATPFYAGAMLDLAGPLVLAVAAAALVRALFRGATPLVAACGALAMAAFLFHILMPIALQERYVLMALPALVVLAAVLLRDILPGLAGPVVLVASVAAWTVFAGPPPVAPSGTATAARAAIAAMRPENPVVLIVADAQTEPTLVANLASLDTRRPHVWALRGSRLLGGGGYNNHEYVPRFANLADAAAEIERYGIPLVLLRHTGAASEWAHVGQVAPLATRADKPWRELARVPDGAADIVLYEVPGQAARMADVARLLDLAAPRALRAASSVQGAPRTP